MYGNADGKEQQRGATQSVGGIGGSAAGTGTFSEHAATASNGTADEVVALYGEGNRVVGAALRSAVRAQNLRHACVVVMVFNGAGEIYVHRRTHTKDVYPGCYDVMAGGVLRAGEEPYEAALREADEELGVTGVDLRPLLETEYSDDRSRYHAFGFVATYDGPIRWQPEEVMWGGWVSPEELLDMVADASLSFAPDTLALMRTWINDGSLWPFELGDQPEDAP